MIDILDMEQGSESWFSERMGSVGSSSVKNAMSGGQGKTRKTLIYNLLGEVISGEKTAFFKSAAMEEGNRREKESREWYSFYSGIEWEEVGLIRNDNFPGQHTSPDAINRKLEIGIELKNVQANTMVKYLDSGKMPTEYIAQCQHAMMITGWKKWHFAVYHPKFTKQLVVILDRDEKYIAEMLKKLGVFFDEMRGIRERIQWVKSS